MIKLFGSARSSAAFRVRIALNLKGLAHEHEPVNLREGRQTAPQYLAINPQGLVPTLIDGDAVLSQSIAILEYLEERHPAPPLLPTAAVDRARVRALSLLVACDIHPLNNLRVLNYLTGDLGVNEEDKLAWYRHWIAVGLSAFEAHIAPHPSTGKFCHGGTPTMADVCLAPQIFNAMRFECPVAEYPTVMRVFDNCMRLTAFETARPEKQPDFV